MTMTTKGFGDMLILAIPIGALVAYFTDCAGLCPGLRSKIDNAIGLSNGDQHPFPYPYATSSATKVISSMGMPMDRIFQPIPRISSNRNVRSRDWVAV